MSQHLENLDGESPTSAITTFDVIKAKPADDLKTLAQVMRDAHVSALFIEDPDGRLAIVSERDIVYAIADDSPAWAVDCMTRDLISVPASTTIADAAEMMLVADIRHIAVEREDGVMGIASIRDLLRPLIDGSDR